MLSSKHLNTHNILYTQLLPSDDKNLDHEPVITLKAPDSKETVLTSKDPIQQVNAPQKAKEIYPFFPMLRIMNLSFCQHPSEVSNLIMSYTSPKDFQIWSETPLAIRNNYSETDEMKYAATKALPISWWQAINEFKAIYQPEQKNHLELPPKNATANSLAKEYEDLFQAQFNGILTSISGDFLSHNPIEYKNARSNALFVSLSKNCDNIITDLIKSSAISDTNKARALGSLAVTGAIDHLQETPLLWDRSNDCCSADVSHLHWITCWVSLLLTGTYATRTSCVICYCHKINLVEQTNTSPIFNASLYAGVESTAALTSTLPNQVHSALKSLNTIMKRDEEKFYYQMSNEKKDFISKKLATAARTKLITAAQDNDLPYAETKEALFKQINEATTEDQCNKLYKKYITENSPLNTPTQSILFCHLFKCSTYSSDKITFIKLIQEKLISFSLNEYHSLSPQENITYCKRILESPVFSETHIANGVPITRQHRENLVERIDKLTRYLSFNSSP